MAKFIKTYENGTVKNELTFREKTYDYTMGSYVDGVKTSDKECFSYQIEKCENIVLEEEYIDIDLITCVDEDEVLEILEELEGLEY